MVKDLITNDREKDFKNVDSCIPKKGIRGKSKIYQNFSILTKRK